MYAISDLRRRLFRAGLPATVNFSALLLSHYAVAVLGFVEMVAANSGIGVNPVPILLTRPLAVFAAVFSLDWFIPSSSLFLALAFADFFTDATTVLTGQFSPVPLVSIITLGFILWARDVRTWAAGRAPNRGPGASEAGA